MAVAFVLSSCSLFNKETKEEGNPVARVYDKYLYQKDLQTLVPADATEEDSITIVKNFVQNWIKEQLELQRAELNLTEEQKNFEEQLENYRNSLIIYAYEKEIVRQKLDTSVSEAAIREYYEKNQNNFELRENIVKAVYVEVDKNAPKLDKLRQWYRSGDEEDLEYLKEYCLQFAAAFNLGEKWVPFDRLADQMPLVINNQTQFISSKPSVEEEDSLTYYFLSIREFKTKDSISPLSFERNNIRNIILNQRKLKLISNMKQEMFETALKKNEFEIY